MKIARDGYREIAIASLVFMVILAMTAWAATAVSPWLWMFALTGVLWIFCIAFFRDPERAIPSGPGLLVSPADGKVTHVDELPEYSGFNGPVRRISIFLSVFDVHINRIPCDGRVIDVQYRPGEFLDARDPECGMRNESNTITIQPAENLSGPVVVRQIAGLIARRIVCNIRPGDQVRRGQRLGLIKFGSRTDLIVSAACDLAPAVSVNDRVSGGSTILMRPARAATRPEADEVRGRTAGRGSATLESRTA